MFFLGSAYPLGKFGLNASMNPIFFGALRMGFVFLCLLPFCKIIIPKKKYLLPLIGFSLCMGAGVNMFLYLSINAVTLLAPITIGAQLSIPFAILISSLFLKESISLKKWIFIFLSFLIFQSTGPTLFFLKAILKVLLYTIMETRKKLLTLLGMVVFHGKKTTMAIILSPLPVKAWERVFGGPVKTTCMMRLKTWTLALRFLAI